MRDVLDIAEEQYAATLDSLEKVAQTYADNFHHSVIEPFCNKHNLRFWSGNGIWFFETPSGQNLDLDAERIQWGIATGNARLTEPVSSNDKAHWVLTCDEDDLPDFLYNLGEIDRLLALDFMGGCLGYWISDFKPSSFDRGVPKEEAS